MIKKSNFVFVLEPFSTTNIFDGVTFKLNMGNNEKVKVGFDKNNKGRSGRNNDKL